MRPLSLLCIPLLLASCANYDFATARLPDGRFDTQKLIADLEASGKDSLSDGIWIPLVHLDITTFERARWDAPAGYELSQITSYGPVFLAGAHDITLYDPKGTVIEQRDLEWLGCGVLWFDRDTRIETIAGPRLQSDWRLLLLLGRDDDIDYVRREK